MRLFSKSFAGDAGFWLRNLKADSIGSWEELHDVFLKYWGKNISYDQFLSEFYSLKGENDEPTTKINWRFQIFYISMPPEIRPSKKLAMVYYVMAQHSYLVFSLLERKSSSLRQLFEDEKGVEENIRACKMLRD